MEEEKGGKLKICNDAECICFRANCKSVWTVWGGHIAAGREKYRTKGRMSSALQGGLVKHILKLWKCCKIFWFYRLGWSFWVYHCMWQNAAILIALNKHLFNSWVVVLCLSSIPAYLLLLWQLPAHPGGATPLPPALPAVGSPVNTCRHWNDAGLFLLSHQATSSVCWGCDPAQPCFWVAFGVWPVNILFN